jgi:hypothetical protein
MSRRDPDYLAARAMKLRMAFERRHGVLLPSRVAALIPTLDAAELEKLEALLCAMMRAAGLEPGAAGELARERAALAHRKQLMAALVRGAEANIAALGRGRRSARDVADIAAGKAAVAEYRRLYPRPVRSDGD